MNECGQYCERGKTITIIQKEIVVLQKELENAIDDIKDLRHDSERHYKSINNLEKSITAIHEILKSYKETMDKLEVTLKDTVDQSIKMGNTTQQIYKLLIKQPISVDNPWKTITSAINTMGAGNKLIIIVLFIIVLLLLGVGVGDILSVIRIVGG